MGKSRRAYAFALSLIVLVTTLVALAAFASTWRRAQEQTSSSLALPSDGARISERINGDLGNILGVRAEVKKNSSSVAVVSKISLPFKKEGLPLADLADYAKSIQATLSGSVPYEIALAPNGVPSSEIAAISIPGIGSVRAGNNGTNGTDFATYSFLPGLGISNISVLAFCGKANKVGVSVPPAILSNPTGVALSYNDTSGQAVSGYTTVNASSSSSFSISFSDGTNFSLAARLSNISQSNITISYTKSPGAALVLTFDANSTSATGGVPDYSQSGSNMTLGGGNSSRSPAWLGTGCHSHGCYSFDGASDFINGTALDFTEAPVGYAETTYRLNGGFENNSSANTFYNWAAVGNATSSDFTQTSDYHSGARALSAASTNASAYAYNNKAVLLGDTQYSLEFWAKQTSPRYAIFDTGNGKYLSLNGSWESALQILNGSVGGGYTKFVRNFRTLPSSVGAVEVRFYAPQAGQTAKVDDVSLTKVSDFAFSFWLKSQATSGSALYQAGAQGRFGLTGFDFSAAGGNITANLSSDGANLAQRAVVGDNQWHHIALVANRTGNYSLYLDGALVSSSNFSLGTFNSTPNLTIGSKNGSGFFTGSLDEIRVYRRALSPSEVQNLYHNRYQDSCSVDISVTYSNATLASSHHTAYYDASLAVRTLVPGAALAMTFDGNVSSNQSGAVLDYSGNANAGALGGGVSSRMPNWTSNGRTGGAYSFNGNLSYVEVPFSQSVNLTQNLTLMAWVYMAAPPNETHGTGIISKGNGLNNGQYELIIYGAPNSNYGKPYFRGTAQNAQFGALCSSNIVNGTGALNQWHFIAATFNGSRMNCYIDGSLDATVDNSGWVMPLNSTNAPLALGTRQIQSSSALTSHFNGTIDEVRIFGRVLSAEEIDSIYADTILIRQGQLIASSD